MQALTQLAQQPYFMYGAIFVASMCLIFGFASFFEARATAATVRRTASMKWVVTGISNKLVPKDENERDSLKTWLLQAGYDAANAVQIYYGIRVTAAVALPAVILIVLPLYIDVSQRILLFGCLVGAIVGFMAPAYAVRIRRARRHRQFREALPDVLDLLLVCSESGLGIDSALMRVGEEMAEVHPLLADQLNVVSSELRAGLDRRDALRGLGARTGIEETVSLVNLLVQSDALGTSMAQTLRAFAEDMRAHRMLRAEDLGQKASAKLTIVLVACFLPAIFAAVLAPAVFSAVKGLHILSVGIKPW